MDDTPNNDDSTPRTQSSIERWAEDFRAKILEIGVSLKDMMADDGHANGADISETKANIMLAYRHLEDARMRLGKVFQAQAGGVSNCER